MISLLSHPILAILSHHRLKLEPHHAFLFICLKLFILFCRNSLLSLRFRILQQTTSLLSLLSLNFLFSFYFLPTYFPPYFSSLFYHTEKARAERECFIGTRRQLQTTPILEKKAQRKL